MDKVIKIARNSLERVWPDLTIILDVDPKVGLGRLNRKFDRIEQKGDGYHQKVREGFLKLARQQRDFIVIAAAAGIETIHSKVANVVEEAISSSTGL
jgi:dTMP kinase